MVYPPPAPTRTLGYAYGYFFLRSRNLFTDPLFSLQSPSSARDKKYNHGEFIDRRCKGVGVGEEERKEK